MSTNKYPSYMLAVGGWRRAGALLYRLTGEHRPTNFDEIRVTMANGSRDIGQMSAQAERLLVMLTAPQPAPEARQAAAPAQANEYPPLGKGSLWRDAGGIRGYGADPGTGPWYTTEDVHKAINADRAASSVYSRSMDLVRVFWQQHTQADALSMTMAELHADVELVIRAARGPAQAAPRNGALAAPAQPVAWALQWPDDSRLNISTVFDTQLEATDYLKSCSDGVVVVPLYAAPQPAAQDAPVDAAVLRDAERLDFMIESCTQVATISPSGRKYLCYPDGRMQAGSYPTARAAIDAAAQKETND